MECIIRNSIFFGVIIVVNGSIQQEKLKLKNVGNVIDHFLLKIL